MSGNGEKSPSKKQGMAPGEENPVVRVSEKDLSQDGFKTAVPFVAYAALVAGVR